MYSISQKMLPIPFHFDGLNGNYCSDIFPFSTTSLFCRFVPFRFAVLHRSIVIPAISGCTFSSDGMASCMRICRLLSKYNLRLELCVVYMYISCWQRSNSFTDFYKVLGRAVYIHSLLVRNHHIQIIRATG